MHFLYLPLYISVSFSVSFPDFLYHFVSSCFSSFEYPWVTGTARVPVLAKPLLKGVLVGCLKPPLPLLDKPTNPCRTYNSLLIWSLHDLLAQGLFLSFSCSCLRFLFAVDDVDKSNCCTCISKLHGPWVLGGPLILDFVEMDWLLKVTLEACAAQSSLREEQWG